MSVQKFQRDKTSTHTPRFYYSPRSLRPVCPTHGRHALQSDRCVPPCGALGPDCMRATHPPGESIGPISSQAPCHVRETPCEHAPTPPVLSPAAAHSSRAHSETPQFQEGSPNNHQRLERVHGAPRTSQSVLRPSLRPMILILEGIQCETYQYGGSWRKTSRSPRSACIYYDTV